MNTPKFRKTKTARKPNYDALRRARAAAAWRALRKEKEATQLASLRAIGASAMASIAEMVETLITAEQASDDDEAGNERGQAAREAIEQDPLSVEVRSGWYALGSDPSPEEYMILLSTGGPAVRIIGSLNGEPMTARLEVQDWFTPWTAVPGDEDTLLTYARCFYWGD